MDHARPYNGRLSAVDERGGRSPSSKHLAMLDFGDTPARSHTFDRGRQPSTAHNDR